MSAKFFKHFLLFFIYLTSSLVRVVQAQDVMEPSGRSGISCPTGYKYSVGWCYKSDEQKSLERSLEDIRREKLEEKSSNTGQYNSEENAEAVEQFGEGLRQMIELMEKIGEEAKIQAERQARIEKRHAEKMITAKGIADRLDKRIAIRSKAPPDTCIGDFEVAGGGYIDSVGPHSERAGLRPGDLIIEQDGIPPRSADRFTSVEWGELTTVRVIRDGKELEFSFKCPFSYSEVIQADAKLVEAIRSEQLSDCRRLAREYDKYTGRSMQYGGVYFFCLPYIEDHEYAEAIRDFELLSIRYYSYEFETLEDFRPEVEDTIKGLESAGETNLATELKQSLEAARQKFLDKAAIRPPVTP